MAVIKIILALEGIICIWVINIGFSVLPGIGVKKSLVQFGETSKYPFWTRILLLIIILFYSIITKLINFSS